MRKKRRGRKDGEKEVINRKEIIEKFRVLLQTLCTSGADKEGLNGVFEEFEGRVNAGENPVELLQVCLRLAQYELLRRKMHSN